MFRLTSELPIMSAFVALGLAALIYVLLKRLTRPSLSDIRGPKSFSFVYGNMLDIFQRPAGQADFQWHSLYGDVVRFKTILGEDQLLIADPKALQQIFSTSSYRYPRQRSLRVTMKMLNGKGVSWAEGEDHRRHRRVLLPGFGAPETRAFLYIFKGCAESMCMKWMEIIENSMDQRAVINVPSWLSRATLDAIGQAAFDVEFGAIQDDSHPLVKVYRNFLNDVFGHPSAKHLFVRELSKRLPMPVLEWRSDHSSNPRLQRAREMKRVSTEVARELVREKAESLLAGKGSRDIFSLLIKANMDSEAKDKLSEEELLAQMCTILFAGHDTTSNSLGWILLELARHPDMQARLRAEIRKMEAAIRARGGTQFTAADFDAMPYMMAVVKEGLRFNPVVPRVERTAGEDDVISLSRPITTESGKVLDQIVVPKGTIILASIAAYNRNKELWGEDAHEFNPNRWLDGVASEKKAVQVGVYSNLMTFTGGPRACLGWRFAVIEIQAFVVEVIGRFELAMAERSKMVGRGPSTLMTPIIEGELERGAQLPLIVSVAVRGEDA